MKNYYDYEWKIGSELPELIRVADNRPIVVLITGDLTAYTFPSGWDNPLRGCSFCGIRPASGFVDAVKFTAVGCDKCQSRYLEGHLLAWEDVVRYTFGIIKKNSHVIFVNVVEKIERVSRLGQTYFGAKIPQNLFLGVRCGVGDYKDLQELGSISKIRRLALLEPLGPISIRNIEVTDLSRNRRVNYNGATGEFSDGECATVLGKLDWVVCAGAVGEGARPMRSSWLEFLIEECRIGGIPFFFRGWGDWINARGSFNEEVNKVFYGERECPLKFDRYDWPRMSDQSFYIGDEITGNAFRGKHPEGYPDLTFEEVDSTRVS